MKKTYVLTIAIMVVISLLISGCGLLPTEDERLDPPIREASEVQFNTETVVRGDIHRTVTLFANFIAANENAYRFSDVYHGRVDEVYVQEGTRVQAGDLMATLETGDLETKLRDVELQYEVARIQYQRTKDRYERNLISEYDMKIAQIDYDKVRNQFDDIVTDRDRSRLYALDEGVVTYVGNFSRNPEITKDTLILRVAKDENLILRGTGYSASNFSEGDEVKIESMGQAYSGRVLQVESNSVEFLPDEYDPEWQIGTVARVTLSIASAQNVLMIPQRAILRYATPHVRVLENGVPIEKQIETGISDSRYIEVTSGLEEGDEVIIN